MASNTVQTSKADIVERVSYISSATHAKDDDYNAVKTPDIEGGALRAGGAPNLWSRECFGLLSQYCAIGLVEAVTVGVFAPCMSYYP
ncbi:hypothetical protein ATCC90586_003368 [Pythium insidiosum]|nr:hypothetical protein ATCC90586_003368 [Pythium insidiosum]